jgi:hypothetical protein
MAVTLTFTLRGFQERKFQGKSRRPCQYFAPSCKSVVKKTAAINSMVVSNVEESNNQWNQSNGGIASSSKTPATNLPSRPGMNEPATITVPRFSVSAYDARVPVSTTTPRSNEPLEGAAFRFQIHASQLLRAPYLAGRIVRFNQPVPTGLTSRRTATRLDGECNYAVRR